MMSKKARVMDTETLNKGLLRSIRVELTPETYAALLELAESKSDLVDIPQKEKFLTPTAALKQAKFWISGGFAPESAILEIKKRSFIRSKEDVSKHILQVFLERNPMIKVAINARGRPPGMSPEAKKRITLGLVIADLVNALPPRHYKKLKAA